MAAKSVGSTELLNVLGDVKARVQDKLGIVDFPMPQFILIGKQSVGKSRLIEALAGETFNFISGTLGSRRPTVVEFRNVPARRQSQWFMRDRTTNQWQEMPVQQVMSLVGAAHEELGETVSPQPVYVRIESPACVDMQIVDLPGFRDFAVDSSKQDLSTSIEELVLGFMRDRKNVMLCVEQANDAATMSTLQRCRQVDPNFERTVLIRNKLDKYYADLTTDNVNQWVRGFGDLPASLDCFALTLPWWRDGHGAPKPFTEMREEKNAEDLRQMQSKGLSTRHLDTIGFTNFARFVERKIERMFSESIGPVLQHLRELQQSSTQQERELQNEFADTNPQRILSTTRECGVSFATALTHVMEGVLNLKPVMTLEEELRQFHAHHQAKGSCHLMMLPSEDFHNLSEYVEYLRSDIQVSTCDVELNGGAQFRRLMHEAEIFLRFSEINVEVQKRDVIQARGISTGSLTWRDVVVKLLSNEAHLPLQRRIRYVGERLVWFFQGQKEAVVEFMCSLEGTPFANVYSPLYPKHAKLIKQNDMIKHLVFQTYDKACARQLQMFSELFENMLTSTFSNPWVFLKTPSTAATGEEEPQEAAMPSFDDTKERIPRDLQARTGVESMLSRWLTGIPTEPQQIDEAVEKVQMLLLKTYGFIRATVCDQVELFSESFFKLPMMRRMEQNMAMIELSQEDEASYQSRRSSLQQEISAKREGLVEINWCIDRLQSFKLKCEARGGA
jgi:GTP-binding protein EngB required for normal cell division